jgi:hypothetical protein
MLGLRASSSLALAASATAAIFPAALSARAFAAEPTKLNAAAAASDFGSPRPINTCAAADLHAAYSLDGRPAAGSAPLPTASASVECVDTSTSACKHRLIMIDARAGS